MAKLTTDEIVEALKEMTLLEASELVKAIEDTFGVSAAAPAAVVAGPAAAAPAEEENQGRPRAHQPWPEGGQGGRRVRPQGRARGCQEGGRRGRQGEARGCRRRRHHQVASVFIPASFGARSARAGFALFCAQSTVLTPRSACVPTVFANLVQTVYRAVLWFLLEGFTPRAPRRYALPCCLTSPAPAARAKGLTPL